MRTEIRFIIRIILHGFVRGRCHFRNVSRNGPEDIPDICDAARRSSGAAFVSLDDRAERRPQRGCGRGKSMSDKIIFVIPDMPGGGTERVVALLANEYAARGMETAILLFAGHQTAYPLADGVEVVSLGEPTGGSMVKRISRIRRMRTYYRQNRGCHIWAFSVMGAVFSAVAVWGHRRGYSILISERNDPDRYEHPRIRNFFYRSADRIVCQTQDAADAFPGGIRKKAIVIPNPVEIGETGYWPGERERRIVAVGRLEPQKNHGMLLRAFARFAGQYPEYVLEIYGKGSQEEELRTLAGELGISGHVIFKGFSGRVREDIRKAAMYVLSSDYEGISNSMLEALAMGIPVIATDCPCGGSRTYIQEGINGLLVPVGDVQAMSDAMKRLAADPQLRVRLGMEAQKLKEQLSIGKIADLFLEAMLKKGMK